MKKIFAKILILLLAVITFTSVMGCSCFGSKDEYSQYPFIDRLNGGIVYNGVCYYQNFDTNWSVDEGFKEIVGKVPIGKLSTITMPVYKHESLEVLKIGHSRYYAEDFVFSNEKELLLDVVKVERVDGFGYLKGTDKNVSENVKESIFNSAITIRDIINENYTISNDEFSIYDSRFSNIYCIMRASTYFKELNYMFLDARFYVYEDKVLLLLNDCVYGVKNEYSTKIIEYVESK